MKKFLIMLMVVAMASFLFVGCLGVTPEPDDPILPNNQPEIISSAITSGKVGVAYTYDVNATDPDEDVLTYTLTEKPLNMTIVANTGVISWTPTDAGLFRVGVMVSDGELSDTQSFSITVAKADDPVDPVKPSTTPVIEEIENIDLYSSDTQYVNKDDVADGILIEGFAPKYSKVQVYIDGVVAGIGYAYGGDETFTVFVSKTNLGADGEKSLGATATETGLVESACSIEYKFTLDTVAPEIEKVTAEIDEIYDHLLIVTATFSEELVKATAEDEDDWTVTSDNLVPSSAKLISPEVVELKVDLGSTYAGVGKVIRVAYEDYLGTVADPLDPTPIKDLAGNPAVESVEYCYAELEE